MEQNASSEDEGNLYLWLQNTTECILLDAGMSAVLLVLVWIFGTFAYFTVLEKFLHHWILQGKNPKKSLTVAQNTQQKTVMRKKIQANSGFNTSVDKTADLVQMLEEWLCNEETGQANILSIEVYTKKLHDACKDMNKASLLVSSFATEQRSMQESCNSELYKEADKIQQLIERFDHVQSYTELRLKLMEILLNLLKRFQAKHDLLKMWAAETLVFLELIHSTECDSEKAIMQNLEHEKKLTEEVELKQMELSECKTLTDESKEVLKEIGYWSSKFKKTIKRTNTSNGKKPWYDHLLDMLDKQVEELNQHICNVTKLSMCYKMHLTDLLNREYSGSTQSLTQKKTVSLPLRIQAAFDEMSQKASFHFKLERSLNKSVTDLLIHSESVQ